VLDLYASAITREQTKYDMAHQKKASVKRKVLLSESDEDTSDSDESFHLIKKSKKKASFKKKTKVQFVSKTAKPDKRRKIPSNEPTAEEKDFLKQITHLEETDESLDKSGLSDDTP
jgi:hypothetical protein